MAVGLRALILPAHALHLGFTRGTTMRAALLLPTATAAFLLVAASPPGAPAGPLPPYPEALRCAGLTEAWTKQLDQKSPEWSARWDKAIFWGMAASEAGHKAKVSGKSFEADQVREAAEAGTQLEARDEGALAELAACVDRVPDLPAKTPAQAPAPAAAAACPIDRQVYVLDGAPQFTAGFDRPEGPPDTLSFWLKTPERTYRFGFVSPNGYGGVVIVPEQREEDAGGEEADPASIEFDAFGPDLKHRYDAPLAGGEPPAFIFIRRLGPALWYDPVGLSGGDRNAKPESMPIGMFRPGACEAASD